MTLQSAIMYLQNVFVSIEEIKTAEVNQSLFYRFSLRQVISNQYSNEEKVRQSI